MTASFTQTSDGLYDRNDYIVYFKDGNKRQFSNWAETQAFWFQFTSMNLLSHVEVADKRTSTKTKAKGF